MLKSMQFLKKFLILSFSLTFLKVMQVKLNSILVNVHVALCNSHIISTNCSSKVL